MRNSESICRYTGTTPIPDPRGPPDFRIPFNAESGEAIEQCWRNWRRHDPINLVSRYRANLKSELKV
jgi:hypothetical protein